MMHQLKDRPACFKESRGVFPQEITANGANANSFMSVIVLGECRAFVDKADMERGTPGCVDCARLPEEVSGEPQ